MEKENIVLTEYQKAQDSAEHYNTMTWTLISVGIGFSLLLLKSALFDVEGAGELLIDKLTLQSLIFFLGSTTLMYFGMLVYGANQKKIFKYKICQKIELENENFIGQNLGTQYLPLTKQKWGIGLFVTAKQVLLLIFFLLGLVTAYKSADSGEFYYVLVLFLGNISMMVISVLLDFKGLTKFEDVLQKVKEKRRSLKN